MSETLQEFLVKIKYAEDTNSKSSMLSGLKSTAGTITSIAEKAAGMAALVGALTFKIAKDVNSLYLTAQNLGGSTVRTFKAMTEAAQDVGSSIDEMTSSLEGLQKFRRMTGEGANQFLRQFAPNINNKDSAPEALLKIAQNIPTLKAQGMREEQFLQAMEVTGVGYDVGYKVWERTPEFLEQQQKHTEAIGTGIDKMAPGLHEQFVEFGLKMDEAINAASLTFGDTLKNVIDGELKIFQMAIDGLEKNSDQIKEYTDAFTGKMNEVIGKFDKLDLSLKGIDKSLERISHPIDLLIDNLGLLTSAIGILSAITVLNPNAKFGGAVGASLLKLLSPRMLGAIGLTSYLGYKIGDKIQEQIPQETKDNIDRGIMGTDENNTNRFERAEQSVKKWISKGNTPYAAKTREEAGMEFFQRVGMSKNDAAGIMGSLHKETINLDPFAEGDNGEAYGIEQWHKDRQKLYRSYFGHTMQSVTDQNQAYAEQLEFIDFERKHSEKENWEKMQAAGDNPYERGAAYSQYIVRPGLTDEVKKAEADARGTEALGIAQQYGGVNITVNGVTDPKLAADIVIQKLNDQSRMNQRYDMMQHQ